PLLSKKFRRALKPVFETRIERKVMPVRAGGAMVELALDHGQIGTPEGTEDICEVEIELKEGDCAGLFNVAHSLAEAVPLRLSVRSKASRGYDLVEGKPAGAVAAEPLVIGAGMPASEAFQAIAEACLYQVVANWEAVCRRDTVGFHEMRIGLRRLRTSI